MSEIKYGLISKTDVGCLEKTIDLVCEQFPTDVIMVTEIGLFDCGTAMGISNYLLSKQRGYQYTGIDNEKDKPIIVSPFFMNFIKGNSNEVYNQIPDNSQHLIFIDGCHCFAHVIGDFFCYAPKVKVGGYLAFHDTGKQIKPFKDFQHGGKENPDAYISVRKALDKIGLFNREYGEDKYSHSWVGDKNWELIFDEADPNDEAGGICVFKKLY